MRICPNCKVSIENDLDYCPLCDMETDKVSDDFELDYPYIKTRFSRRLFAKIVTFLAVVFAAVSFLINHLVPTDNPWAFITAAAIAYIWLNLMNLISNARNPGSITLWQLLTVSGLTFVIDYLTGWHKWSVNYVIPALIMAAAVAIVLCIAIRPVKYRAYTLYQLVIAVLGVLAVLLWIFGYSDVEWPVVAAAATSLLCFAAMVVFANRYTRNELKKRFHVK
ncbi:MAG: hypothetical protein HFE63_09365 [Clostridiales bacterium]|nr:hypothetical protein [Clostridiales bacterium]